MKVFQCAIRMSKDKLNVYHHQQITPTERTWIEFSQHGLPVTQRTFNERLNNAPCAVLIGEKRPRNYYSHRRWKWKRRSCTTNVCMIFRPRQRVLASLYSIRRAETAVRRYCARVLNSVCQIQQAFTQYGGCVENNIMDGRACCFMSFFQFIFWVLNSKLFVIFSIFLDYTYIVEFQEKHDTLCIDVLFTLNVYNYEGGLAMAEGMDFAARIRFSSLHSLPFQSAACMYAAPHVCMRNK